MSKRWVTVGEVAERLHISRNTAAKYLKDGTVPGRLTHLGYTRVERKVFETWLNSKDRAQVA